MNNIYSIRGATTADNTVESISLRSNELLSEMLKLNFVNKEDVINLVCSTTADLTRFYPVRAVREAELIDAPLFSSLEPPIENALSNCIRFMLTIYSQTSDFKPKHIYLHGAKILRKDIAD